MGKELFTAQQFINAIPGTGGIISTIAKKVGCQWHTAKKYIDEHPTVKQAYDNEKRKIDDAAVSVIYRAIMNGDLGTAKWWASMKLGDDFHVTGILVNPGPERSGVPTLFVLDVYGEMWFWPSWSHYSSPGHGEIDFVMMEVPTGWTYIEVVPHMIWPDTGSEAAEGLYFYGAMLNPAMDRIEGEWAAVEWQYGPGLP